MFGEQEQEGEAAGTVDYSAAEALIGQAESTELKSEDQPKGELVVVNDEPEGMQSAKVLVRLAFNAFRSLVRLKDQRIEIPDQNGDEWENRIAPALVKHGVGSGGGVSQYAEEFDAVLCLGGEAWGVRGQAKALREYDEQQEEAKKGNGDQSQPLIS